MNDFLKETIKNLIVPAIIAAWAFLVWEPFQNNYTQFNKTEFIVLLALLTATACIDFDIFRKPHLRIMRTLPYAAAIAAFFLFVSQQSHFNLAPGMLLTGISGIFLIVRFIVFANNYDHEPRHPLGHAATSILFEELEGGSKNFVLIKNGNLNGEKHLWLSPGGKWVPEFGDPALFLASKVAAEVNLRSQLWEQANEQVLLPPLEERNDEACIWYTPPQILLLETLQAPSMAFPDQHLDMIYICKSSGEAAGVRPKYDRASQLRVSVDDCCASVEAAQAAVQKSIDGWSIETTGQRQSLSDTVTRDLIWRLHLAAKAISQ